MKITYDTNPSGAETGLAPWLRRGLLLWLVAVTVEYLFLEESLRDLAQLKGIAQMAPIRMVLVAVLAGTALYLLRRHLTAGIEQLLLAAVYTALSMLVLRDSFSWPFFGACLLVQLLILAYALWGWASVGGNAAVRCRENRRYAWAAGIAAVVFFVFVSLWTACRVFSFSTPTFDFGIFAQMFHSMKTTGLPITTVERDGALSHFAVHVSPIYYLLLPFYMIVPHPATLQVLQAAVLASAVIPLWLLGRHHNLNPAVRFLLCLLLFLYPAYAGGTSYDIHENAFLTPLLLWLFYGIDRKNRVIVAISALLTLMVKEDSAVYVAVVALYLLLHSGLRQNRKWGLVTGGALLALSVCWFFATTSYLATSGDGVMTYRYNNFMYDKSDSLVTVIKAVLLSPMKALYECVDKEKLPFIGMTLGALAGIPLMTRRYERLVLLIPYLLVNLMTDYKYQFDIFFQYTYGSTACLIYLVLVNIADWKLETHRVAALGLALGISFGCFCNQIIPKAVRYPTCCKTYGAYYDSLRAVLDEIPKGASAAATTYYTTYLSQRDVLYDVRYTTKEHVLSCEYVAVGVTDSNCLKKYAVDGKNGYENFVTFLESNGYVKIAEHKGKLEIYHKEK